jgi:uncharacterized protein (TIGR03067 family)
MHHLRSFLSALKPTRLGVLFAVLIGLGVGFWQWIQPPRPRVVRRRIVTCLLIVLLPLVALATGRPYGVRTLLGQTVAQEFADNGNEKEKVVWEVLSVQMDGKEDNLKDIKQTVVLSGNKVTIFIGKKMEGAFKLKVDKMAKPKALDLIDREGFVWRGIYERKGDNLKVCLVFGYRRQPDHPRPTTFDTKDQKTILYNLRKLK